MKTTTYQPINCSFYDELEQVATLRKEVEIIYRDRTNQPQARTCLIVDLRTSEGVEYLIDDKQWELRLDQLISVDGKALKAGYCGV